MMVIFFLGTGERVEITHRAQSREAFAAGALQRDIERRHGRPHTAERPLARTGAGVVICPGTEVNLRGGTTDAYKIGRAHV